MKAKYDTEMIEVTEDYIAALAGLMIAECEMMRAAQPEFADCWTWGRVEILDFAQALSLAFSYGGDEDIPDDGLGSFGVLSSAAALDSAGAGEVREE